MRAVLALFVTAVVALGGVPTAEGKGRCDERRPWCDTRLPPDRRAALLLRR